MVKNVDKKMSIITIPKKLNIAVVSVKNEYASIIIYNANIFVSLLTDTYYFVDETTNSLVLYKKKPSLISRLFEYQFSTLITSVSRYFLKKIKYKGRIYKITKRKKKIFKFRFGKTKKIRMKIRFKFVRVKKRKKKLEIKTWIFFTSKNYIIRRLSKIRNVRPWNMYTQRGMRFGKQKIYKKTGKKSTYF